MTTRLLLAFGCIVLGVVPTAEAGNESERSIDASNQVVFPLRWQQPLVREGTHRTLSFTMGRPAVSNRHELVIVGTGERRLIALSTRSGSEIWAKDFPAELEAFGGIGVQKSGQEVALFSSRDGIFHCVGTDTGVTLWSVTLSAESRAEPNVLPEGVLVTNAQSELVLLDIENGKRIWSKRRTPPSGMTVLGHSRPLIFKGRAYVGFSDGYVAAFDIKTGKEIWAMPASLNQDKFADVDADPVLIDGQLIVASYSSGIVSLDPENGKRNWSQAAKAVNRLAGDHQRLFAASGDGLVWRLNPKDGSVVYRVRLDNGPVSRMTLKGNLLTFAGGPNGLVVLDALSGKPLQATAMRGGANSDPNWSDLGIFVLSNRGDLYAFDVR
jgi:outer membrane protein assembly factor BamB